MVVLTSSGTAAVCNLGFMAELDSSGSCVLPGRLPVTESRVVQVIIIINIIMILKRITRM